MGGVSKSFPRTFLDDGCSTALLSRELQILFRNNFAGFGSMRFTLSSRVDSEGKYGEPAYSTLHRPFQRAEMPTLERAPRFSWTNKLTQGTPASKLERGQGGWEECYDECCEREQERICFITLAI